MSWLLLIVAIFAPPAHANSRDASGVTSLDVYVAGRPVHSADIRRKKTELAVITPEPLVAGTAVQFLGYDRGTLVARALTKL